MSRRKSNKLPETIASLVMLIVVISFYPPLRPAAISAAIFMVAVGALVLLVYLIARSSARDRESMERLYSHTPKQSPSAVISQQTPSDTGNIVPISASPNDCTPTSLTNADLIRRIYDLDWFQFEQIVAVIYRQQGYAVARRGGANPDGGIDLVATRECSSIAVQCKHWKSWQIGVRTVRELLGSMTDAHIRHGHIVTLTGYAGDAKKLADKHGIEFINESALRTMLDQVGAATNPEILEILNDTRKYCPRCEAQMTLRTTKRGPNAGANFWGCSRYPRCKFMLPFEQKAA